MNIKSLNIEIIDTHENNRVLIDEKTHVKAAHLIYNGVDHKFQAIMTSDLHFSILLKNDIDGALLHLYTGNETRYKVLLNDITDDQNIKTLWQGFLLPEQYSEPYKNGSIFINLIASDGIGRIKNIKLSDNFYSDKKSIIDIIVECLKQTGSDLNIKIAPAIFNIKDDLTFDLLDINTSSYIDNDKKITAFNILNNLLISIGCKVFQYVGTWYVIGINRMNEEEIKTHDDDLIIRNVIKPLYKATPLVGIKPKLQNVTVIFDPKYNDNVLREDIVYQLPETTVNLNDQVVKYWSLNNIDLSRVLLSSKEAPGNWSYCFLCFGYNYLTDPQPGNDPFYLTIQGYSTNVSTDYIELLESVYIEKGFDLGDVNLSFNLELLIYTPIYNLSAQLNIDALVDKFKYEVLLGDEVLISNKSPIPYDGNFDYKLSSTSDNTQIKATLNIKKIPINKSGYLQIRISPPLSFDTSPLIYTLISKLEIGHDYGIKEVSVDRSIDFTTSEKIDVFHGDDLKDLTNRAYLINDSYQINNNDQDENISEQLTTPYHSVMIIPIIENGVEIYIEKYTFDLDEASYQLIIANPEDLYILKNGDSELTYLPIDKYDLFNTSPPTISTYRHLVQPDQIYFAEHDELHLKTDNQSVNNTDTRLLRNKWKRYNTNEEITYLEALAKINHSAQSENRFLIDTTVLQLITPLDILVFSFINDKKYIPTKLDLDLFEGSTLCTLIESEYDQNIIDYVN